MGERKFSHFNLHNVNFRHIDFQVVAPASEVSPNRLQTLTCWTPRRKAIEKRLGQQFNLSEIIHYLWFVTLEQSHRLILHVPIDSEAAGRVPLYDSGWRLQIGPNTRAIVSSLQALNSQRLSCSCECSRRLPRSRSAQQVKRHRKNLKITHEITHNSTINSPSRSWSLMQQIVIGIVTIELLDLHSLLSAFLTNKSCKRWN